MSRRHRKPTASAKKVAKIPFTGAGSQRADHAGRRSAGARAGCPLKCCAGEGAIHCPRGCVSGRARRRRGCCHHAGVAFAEPTDTSSSSSSSDSSSSASSSSSESAASTSSTGPTSATNSSASSAGSFSGSTSGIVQSSVDTPASSASHRVTLRRQTHALGLCRVRAARTPALHLRAATPPHQPGRRPPKPGCPLPSPRRHPPSHRPPRCPPSNQPQRRPPSHRRRVAHQATGRAGTLRRAGAIAGCTSGGNTGNPGRYRGRAPPGCAARWVAYGSEFRGQRPDEPFRIGAFDIGEPAVNGGRRGRRDPRVDRFGFRSLRRRGVGRLGRGGERARRVSPPALRLSPPRLPMIPWHR